MPKEISAFALDSLVFKVRTKEQVLAEGHELVAQPLGGGHRDRGDRRAPQFPLTSAQTCIVQFSRYCLSVFAPGKSARLWGR
jgi:hypothetical protein